MAIIPHLLFLNLYSFIIIFPVGIKYDTVQKKLDDSTEREGLHTGPPGFEFIKFPSVYKSLTFNDLEVSIHVAEGRLQVWEIFAALKTCS